MVFLAMKLMLWFVSQLHVSKIEKPYSVVCGFMHNFISITILCVTHHCLWGFCIPASCMNSLYLSSMAGWCRPEPLPPLCSVPLSLPCFLPISAFLPHSAPFFLPLCLLSALLTTSLLQLSLLHASIGFAWWFRPCWLALYFSSFLLTYNFPIVYISLLSKNINKQENTIWNSIRSELLIDSGDINKQ